MATFMATLIGTFIFLIVYIFICTIYGLLDSKLQVWLTYRATYKQVSNYEFEHNSKWPTCRPFGCY